jgi:ribonuclease Z
LFQLTILGSSGAIPAYDRYPSCQHLVIQNRYFLIDCGEGAQMQMSKLNLSHHRLEHILISHLHGDHYLGLMGLLFTMHLNNRVNPLHIYAFRGLTEILITHLRHSRSSLNFRIHFHELTENKIETIFEDDAITVETIPLRHKLSCCGFLFREKTKPRRIDKAKLFKGMLLQHIAQLKSGADVHNEKGEVLYRSDDFTMSPRKSFSYAYCSDTAFHPPIATQLNNVNLMYHEATFTESEKSKAVDTFHSTASEAAEIARLANAGKLLLGHFSARYRELDVLLGEARAIFPATELALESSTFELSA